MGLLMERRAARVSPTMSAALAANAGSSVVGIIAPQPLGEVVKRHDLAPGFSPGLGSLPSWWAGIWKRFHSRSCTRRAPRGVDLVEVRVPTGQGPQLIAYYYDTALESVAET